MILQNSSGVNWLQNGGCIFSDHFASSTHELNVSLKIILRQRILFVRKFRDTSWIAFDKQKKYLKIVDETVPKSNYCMIKLKRQLN